MPDATIDPELELPVAVAEIVALYASSVFDVRHFARGAYTVGDARGVSFPLLSSVLPDPSWFPLVRWHAGAIALRFTADMDGELIEGHKHSSLNALIASGRAAAIDGAFTVTLAPGDRAEIAVEAVTFQLRTVPAARRPAFSSGFRWEWRSHALVMFMLLGTLLLLAHHRPNLAEGFVFDEWPEDMRFVGFILRPRAVETVRDRIALPPPRPPADGQSKTIRERGTQGKPTAKSEDGHFAVARRSAPAPSHTRQFSPDVEEHHPGGMLGLYRSRLGYFLVSGDTWLDRPSDLEEVDIWGRRGPELGEAHGLGGRGTRGTGRDGGSWYAMGALGGAGGGLDGVPRAARPGQVWRDPGVVGPLALADVRRIVGWRKAALRRCGSLGAATLQFTINGSGLVTELTSTPAGPRATRAARCVARQIRRMWFPRGLGSLRVRYPFQTIAAG
jgi:hypothetical protein